MLTEARAAYDEQAWARAFAAYSQAGELDADDLDRFAVSAMLLGNMDEYFAIRERAYRELLAAGDKEHAAQAALWVGMQRMVQGEVGPGSGWLSRAGRLCAELDEDSVAGAFMVLASSFEALGSGQLDRAVEIIDAAVARGRALGIPDLISLALHQQGLILLELGRADEGFARMDEAMVGVTDGEISPLVSGIVYCGVIAGCWSAYDLRRAQHWTAAMSVWCDAQTDLGNFAGECKVRRAELKQLQGAWPDARDELAGVSITDIDPWAGGNAAYLRGNLDRLQGYFDEAEENFADAARLGCDPQPGLALLRLARGSVQAAWAMARRSLAESQEPGKRVELLVAAVEIALAAGERTEAEAASAELGSIGERLPSPVVSALHNQADGTLRLAERLPEAALPPLRRALDGWLRVPSPYQEARTRLLIADACRALGDHESAERETTIARDLLTDLGALPDLSRLAGDTGPLSPRELEVLRLVATGATNKVIAAKLVLSERTVDRHVSNILTKLEVSSRAAATAYALERGLL